MTFPGLECFVTVCQELNYTRAADRLFISQPGVSKHIKALEDELGTPLFDKSNTKKLRLTHAGRILYDCVIRCKYDFDSALTQIKQLSMSQLLELNYIEGTTLPGDLFHALDAFQERIRPAELILQSIQHRDTLSALNHDQMVFLSKNELPVHEDEYSKILLYENIPLYLFASTNHPAFREGHTPSPKDFKDSTFYVSKGFNQSFFDKGNSDLFDYMGFEPTMVSVRNYETVRLYLKSSRSYSAGTAFNDSYYSKYLGRLKTSILTNYYLVWKKTQYMNSYISELISIFRQFKPEK